MRISDWSSDVCSSDLRAELVTAVINRDYACGREWIAAQRSRIDVIPYGIEGETPDLPHLIARELTLDGQGNSFVVDSHLRRASIRSRLLGRFSVDILLAALGAMVSRGRSLFSAVPEPAQPT